MSGFTPGPWELENTCSQEHRWVVTAEHPYSDSSRLHIARSIETEANAHLIAAAPELYEALTIAAKRFRGYEQIHRLKGTEEGYLKADNNADLAIFCETALTKARGKQ